MLIYEKKVQESEQEVRHLFGNNEDVMVPTTDDVQLTYKDEDGNVITPALNDTYRDDSYNGVKRIFRESDGKYVNVFIGDIQIIGDEVVPPEPPVTTGYKHTIRMYADGDTDDVEFNVFIENEDETAFTVETLDTWLAEGGYTTAADNYYEDVETVAGTPNVIGVASKGDGAVVAEFEGGSRTNTTFFSDTVTPAN